ncbi:hypothetical protein [uncultured Haemophilus sp.]|uniref:hypothetical protein n=1 Tax=uncultured Haemophilus sp. TaxID=237779 RepID=UPI00265EC853|nr:hypothetical protein [uncultured Haemophilus sp.]
MMLFNLDDQTFAPDYLVSEKQGWIEVNQDEIDGISASITGGGEVWLENGVIKYSGKAPSEYHVFDSKSKSFKVSDNKKTEFTKRKKENLLNELSDKADKIKNDLLAGYPQTEIESFYRQEKEALAWQTNNKADTPMLKQIARIRNIPFEVLVQKVIEKSEQFALAVGVIIGQRQAFEDRLLATNTLEELTALEKEIEEWKFQAN